MKNHLDKFDILRGLAIILVVGYHALSAVFENYEIANPNNFVVDLANLTTEQLLLNLNPFAFGHTGVVLFLIISGFLIHYNYLLKGKAFDAVLFFNKRFWRIYPPYLVALILFGITAATTTLSDWFYHLFLIHNLRNAYIYSINPSFWSLALEVQLYLIYPFYLYLSNRFGNSKAFLISAGVSFAFVLARVIWGIDNLTFYTSVFSYWVIWTIGAYLAFVYHSNRRLSSISLTGLLLFLLVLFGLRLTILHQYLSPYLFSLFFVLMIDKLLHTDLKARLVYKYLELIGLCSYSIYLFHQPVFNYFKDSVFRQRALTSSMEIGIIVLVTLILILICYLSYRMLELKSISIGTNFYKRFLEKKSTQLKPSLSAQND